MIFTEYRATQKWLYEQLAIAGLAAGERLMMLYGGMQSQERERIKAAFQAHPSLAPVRILLATDAASEGLDFQNHCADLIHYEIPWNPNRMEQRNGRIDRHGQRASRVNIYHFVGQGYSEQATAGASPGDLDGDLEFLMRAALKVNNIREDLGKVGPVIAAQVEEAMLGQRVALETTQVERESEPVRRMLKFERQVRDQIQRLQEQLNETRASWRLTPANIEAVVKVGLEIAQQPALEPVLDEPGLYHLPPLRGSWAACAQGLPHPHTGEIRPIVFDPERARGRDDGVLVHLNHRLVQMCLRLLRAEVWLRGDRQNLNRATAKVIPNALLDTPAVIAYGRLAILGGDQQRLHEQVVTAGGVLREGRFKRLNVTTVEQLLAAAQTEPITASMQQRLLAAWDSYAEPLLKSLENRAEERAAALQRDLQQRCEQEVSDITAILQELAQSIRQELEAAAQPQQLELFSASERDQLERDRSNLQRRLGEIPREIEQETRAIRDRFANPTPRLFPLAILYLVPQKLNC